MVSSLFSGKLGATIEVKVRKVFEPITMSPVMVVWLNSERKNFVLKLYDRRFAPRLRKSEHIRVWDEQCEKSYALSGAASWTKTTQVTKVVTSTQCLMQKAKHSFTIVATSSTTQRLWPIIF